jgi:hypothetical protein
MRTLRSLSLPVLFGFVAILVVGCDGFDTGVDPEEAMDETGPTVSFAQRTFSAVESSDSVSIGVQLVNPPGREVTAEVLYVNDSSSTSAADFNIPDSAAVSTQPNPPNAYVAGGVTFPAPAGGADTLTAELALGIQDSVRGEDRETGVFVLQKVRNATIGSPSGLSITIGAITVLSEDFSDESLDPFSAVSVASGNDWQTDTPPVDNAPVAEANGFGADEPSNDWLISQAFNFNQLEDETLSFRSAKGFDDSEIRGLQVKVSTDYDGSGNPENFTWTDVSDQVTFPQNEDKPSGSNFTPFIDSGRIDLSGTDFQSDETYVAFHYRSSGTGGGSAANWQVDDIILRSSTPPQGQ